MIELTENQRQELPLPEPVAIDPVTQEKYVLVRSAVYERIKAMLNDVMVYTSAEMLDRIMAEDDANDPHLAELQKK